VAPEALRLRYAATLFDPVVSYVKPVFDGDQTMLFCHQVFADTARVEHVPVDGLRGSLELRSFEHGRREF